MNENELNIQRNEFIKDPGHEFLAVVSQIWDSEKNLVMESHFGRIIEVVRDENGNLVIKKD